MGKLKAVAKKHFKPTTVRVLIATHDGEILFLKRSKKRKHGKKWDLPGGSVELGETEEQAALRETYEETGFDLGFVKPLEEIDSNNRRRVLFVGILSNAATPTLDNEHTKYKWKDGLENMPNKMHPKTRDLIKRAEEQVCDFFDSFVFDSPNLYIEPVA